MRTVDIIHKKREGKQLSREEINFLIQGYSRGEIPDYQMSAWTMAVFFQGMSKEETGYLTSAMVESGDQLDLSSIEGIKVDKHSTGGVGDTTTLVLAPLVASCGVPVAKMSGRGLGHTGGTIDKLEAFSGFSVEISNAQFIEQVNTQKLAVIGQTGNLTPADKKLYALRDVTATVDSIPLIASSIMSKKIAAGADAIVLDVKVGSGAFMKSVEHAKELAQAMVEIGEQVGRKTVAIISDMNQPLGYAIGNALEIKEAIATLQGKGPKDLEELCLALGAQMLVLGQRVQTIEEGRELLKAQMLSGAAIEALKCFVEAQGGDPRQVEQPDLLPQAQEIVTLTAKESGYIHAIEAEMVGNIAMQLGAGRATKQDIIDLAVGIVLNKKIGDPVEVGEALAYLHVNKPLHQDLLTDLYQAFTIQPNQVNQQPLIYAQLT